MTSRNRRRCAKTNQASAAVSMDVTAFTRALFSIIYVQMAGLCKDSSIEVYGEITE